MATRSPFFTPSSLPMALASRVTRSPWEAKLARYAPSTIASSLAYRSTAG